MRSIRASLSTTPSSFGRRALATSPAITASNASSMMEDVKLFAITFLGGFLFVAIYLG